MRFHSSAQARSLSSVTGSTSKYRPAGITMKFCTPSPALLFMMYSA